jgi:hypothetical protein
MVRLLPVVFEFGLTGTSELIDGDPSPSYVAINVDGSGVDLVTKGVSAHYAGIELHMTLIYLPVRLVLLLFGRLYTFTVILTYAVRTPSDP